MNDLSDFVKKAFYLGVGVASYAGEQAGQKVSEIQEQAQQLADEMIKRGEMSTEEANRWLNQFSNTPQVSVEDTTYTDQPKTIELDTEEEELQTSSSQDLHKQVSDLEEELRRLHDS